MNIDDKIVNEIRKAYDAMPLEEIDDKMKDIEIEPIDASGEQRIKDRVKEKLNNLDKDSKKRTKAKARRTMVAAATFVFVLVGAVVCGSERVRASIAKLFGFVPGRGVVEVEGEEDDGESGDVRNTDWYILDNNNLRPSKDDKISLTIKDAVISGDILELRYTVYLSDITDNDLENVYTTYTGEYVNPICGLYYERGYNNYFKIADGDDPVVTPISTLMLNGNSVEAADIKVTTTESLESARTVCISQFYNVSDILSSDTTEGTLTLGKVSVDFSMKQLEFASSAEGAVENGYIAEIDGVKILCVPTWEGDNLYVDYYSLEIGEYSNIGGFRTYWYPTDVLSVNGTVVEGIVDESYIFDNEGSTHIGSRIKYDLSGFADKSNIVINANDLLVEKSYEDKGLSFAEPLTPNQTIDEVVQLDDISVEVDEISNQYLSAEDGYEESEYGYLIIKLKVTSQDETKQFVSFADISVNGELVDGFYIKQADIDYTNISIPLTMPYEDINSIEFESIEILLNENIKFEL